MSTAADARTARLLKRLETAWMDFTASYTGLPDTAMEEPGVAGEWSVKDVLAHVTTWEEEALKYLPLIVEGGRPPRYATYGGIDAFNERKRQEKASLSLSDVRRHLEETHRRLLELIASVPFDRLASGTRARHRLRLDSYGHYPEHAAAVHAWRRAPDSG